MIDSLQRGFDLLQAFIDKALHFPGGLALLVFRELIVHLDKVVENIGGLVRIAGRQRHLQKTGILGVRTGNSQTGKKRMGRRKGGGIVNQDLPVLPGIIHS